MRIRTLLVLVLLLTVGKTIRPAEVSGHVFPLATALHPSAPADNPTTPAKVALGRLLFWDPILSGGKDVSCASCHHPAFGYSDGLRLSVGVGGAGVGDRRTGVAGTAVHFAKRNSQTVLNAAFNGLGSAGATTASVAPMFWDMRASGLEAQALEPIKSVDEMRGDSYGEAAAIDSAVARLRAIPSYATMFNTAFGGGAASVTAPNLARALAAFERTLTAVNSPYDRYVRGDRSAMTATQVAGMEAFERTGCAACHSGPMFSDYKAHVLRVPGNRDASIPDEGVNGTGAFRTPSLRNLAATGPYMHNGALDSLDDVLRFYNRAGRGQGRGGRGRNNNGNFAAAVTDDRPQTDPLLRELRGVRRDGEDIKAFLMALNDDRFDRIIPARVPSGLTPGGSPN